MFFWPCIINWLYINYQLDELIIIYSQNTILLYMFRASSAHLQEDIVVYKQHMVPSLSTRVLVACRYAARVRTNCRGKVVGGCLNTPTNNLPPPDSSHSSCVSTDHQNSYREWRYHMLLVYNYVLLKMSTWWLKHVEESNILLINNSQCLKLVINV